MLYKVRVSQDVYVGTAAEVVAFMMRADGAPAGDAAAYMRGVAVRIAERLGIEGIATEDEQAFLESLGDRGVVSVEVLSEPTADRADVQEALGDGPIAFGPGVDPDDVDLA